MKESSNLTEMLKFDHLTDDFSKFINRCKLLLTYRLPYEVAELLVAEGYDPIDIGFALAAAQLELMGMDLQDN